MRAGSGAADGYFLDKGLALNAATSTYRAGGVASQGWADGQNVATSVPPLERLRYRVPKVSSAHLSARLLVVADAMAAGVVRLRRVDSGANQLTAAFAAPGVYTTAALDLTGAFTSHIRGDYTDLAVDIMGTGVQLDDVFVWIEDHDPSGAYPGASGALNAGTIDGAWAFDDGELAADRPASARLLRGVRDTIAANDARLRVLRSWSGIIGETAATEHQWLTPYVHRAVVPVHGETRTRERLVQVWVRAYNNTLNDFDVVIAHGPGDALSADRAVWLGEDDPYITRITIPNSVPALTWYEKTVRIPESRDYARDFPGVYPGITNLHLHCGTGDANAGLAGYAAWMV